MDTRRETQGRTARHIGARAAAERAGDRGREAERLARDFLVEHGLEPLAENWQRRLGEIDLVMRDGASGTIVFVEVRYRRHRALGGGLASVDRRKRGRLVRAARAWLQRHAEPGRAARIDVVAVGPPPARPAPEHDVGVGPTTALREGLWLEWVIDAVGDDG